MQNDGEIYLEGKKYISSKRAAKLTGYTHDYVGQLSRAGKIEGSVIGKTRFVDEESLLKYKKENNGVKKENKTLAGDSWEGMLFGKVSDAIKSAGGSFKNKGISPKREDVSVAERSIPLRTSNIFAAKKDVDTPKLSAKTAEGDSPDAPAKSPEAVAQFGEAESRKEAFSEERRNEILEEIKAKKEAARSTSSGQAASAERSSEPVRQTEDKSKTDFAESYSESKKAPILSQIKSEEQNRESSTSEPNQNDLGEVGKEKSFSSTRSVPTPYKSLLPVVPTGELLRRAAIFAFIFGVVSSGYFLSDSSYAKTGYEYASRTSNKIASLVEQSVLSAANNIALGSREVSKVFSSKKINVSDINIPEIAIPEIQIAKISFPKIKIPNIALPEIQIASLDIFDISIPEIAIPEIKITKIKNLYERIIIKKMNLVNNFKNSANKKLSILVGAKKSFTNPTQKLSTIRTNIFDSMQARVGGVRNFEKDFALSAEKITDSYITRPFYFYTTFLSELPVSYNNLFGGYVRAVDVYANSIAYRELSYVNMVGTSVRSLQSVFDVRQDTASLAAQTGNVFEGITGELRNTFDDSALYIYGAIEGIKKGTRETVLSWFDFSGDTEIVIEVPEPSPAEEDLVRTDDSKESTSNGAGTKPTTIVERIIETRVVKTAPRQIIVSSVGVTEEDFERRLQELNNELRQEIYRIQGGNSSNTLQTVYQTIAHTNKIDRLDGVTITNATISGSSISGLTDADIPDGITASGYLALSGGTITGELTVTASTTFNGIEYLFPSADGTSGQALTTDAAGGLSWTTIVGGGGGTSDWQKETNFGALALTPTTTIPVWFKDTIYASSTAIFDGSIGIGTSSPYAKLSVVGETVAEYFTATSTSATSTFGGGLNVGSGGLVYDYSSGNVGIGTAAPLGNVALTVNGHISPLTSQGGSLGRSSKIWDKVYTNELYGNSLMKIGATDGSSHLYITSSGNVGIGTTSPYAKLSVEQNAGEIGFAIGSSTATNFIVDASGYVGIGTAAPGKALDVIGAIQATIGSNSRTIGFDTPSGATGLIGYSRTSNVRSDIAFDETGLLFDPGNSGDSGNVLFASTGEVGIGTTSPYAKLSVVGEVVGEYFTATSTTATSTFGGGLSVSRGVKLGTDASDNVTLFEDTDVGDSDNGKALVIYRKAPEYDRTLTFYIDSFGRSIMQASAGEFRLALGGGNVFYTTSDNMKLNTPYTSIGTTLNALNTLDVDGGAVFGTSYTGTETAPTNGLLVEGNVGIGTTSPYAKLSVVGEVVGEYFTATSTTATSTFPQLSATSLAIGSDYITDITGTNLSITDGVLSASGGGGGDFAWTPSTTYGENTSATATPLWLQDTLYASSTSFFTGLASFTNASTSQLTVTGPAYFNSSTTFNGVEYLYPGADGSNGQILASDGAGGLSWSTVSQGTTISPSFSVHRNGGTQDITNSAWNEIVWTDEEFDTNNDFYTGTSTSYFKPSVAGKYLLTATLNMNLSDGNRSIIEIRKNGAEYKYGNDLTQGGAGNSGISVSVVVDANGTTDYFEVWGWQGSGITKSIGGNTLVTYFTGSRIDGGGLWTDGGDTSYLATTDNVGIGTSTAYSALTVWGDGTGTGQAFEVVNNASTTLLTVLDNGNIGVGTTSPYAKLSVVGEIVAEYFTATSTTATSTFAGVFAIGTTTPDGSALFEIGTSSPLVFVDKNSGYVGIGTAAPGTSLDIDGTLRLDTSSDGTYWEMVESSGVLYFSKNAYWNAANFSLVNGDGALTTSRVVTANLRASGSGRIMFEDSTGNDIAIFDSSDNFGVGTTSPYAQLTVWGDGTSGASVFEVVDSASTTLMTVLDNGNVGIGTTSPYANFSVVGDLVVTASTTFNGVEYLYPGADGSNAQVLTSNGAGGLSWSTVSQGTTISPSFSVHKGGTDQTGIVTSTWTKLTWSTEIFDTNSDFASDKFTPTAAGKYLITAKVLWSPSLVDQSPLKIAIYKNGVFTSGNRTLPSGTDYHGVDVTAILEANGTTDYFEIYVHHQAGSDRSIYGSSALTYFSGSRIDGGGLWTDGGDTSYLATTDNVGVGTSTAYSALTVWGDGTSGASVFEVVDSASTTLMTVLDNGNVGIGTTSPSLAFAIDDSDSTLIGMEMANADSNQIWRLQIIGSGVSDRVGNWEIRDETNGVNPMTFQSSTGNIGMSGCLDPSSDLEIGGTGTNCDTGTGSYINAGSTQFTANSSMQWKENIIDFSKLNILQAIQGVAVRNYDWKDEYCDIGDCKDRIGFIAEEFYTVFERGTTTQVSGDEIQLALWLGMQERNKIINLSSATTSVSSIYIDPSGNIGIGGFDGLTASTTPQYKLHVTGDIAATAFINISTQDAKEDISFLNNEDYDDALEKIKQTNLAQYHYIGEDPDSPLRLGLIAEEAPLEVLSVDEKGVDLYKMTTLAWGAVKAQISQIEDLEARVAALELGGVLSSDEATTTPSAGTALDTSVISDGLVWAVDQFKQIGVTISQGAISAQQFVADKIIAKKAVLDALEMTDSVTGEVYCLRISNGEWDKFKGTCGEVSADVPVAPVPESVPTPVFGCTDSAADNYDAAATEDDGSCTYPDLTATTTPEIIPEETATTTATSTPSVPDPILGCIDDVAENYDADATEDDGSCTYPPEPVLGCTDSTADNYDVVAEEDDGSCMYSVVETEPEETATTTTETI